MSAMWQQSGFGSSGSSSPGLTACHTSKAKHPETTPVYDCWTPCSRTIQGFIYNCAFPAATCPNVFCETVQLVNIRCQLTLGDKACFFIPKERDRVEVGDQCRPVKVFHTELEKAFLMGLTLCTVMLKQEGARGQGVREVWDLRTSTCLLSC